MGEVLKSSLRLSRDANWTSVSDALMEQMDCIIRRNVLSSRFAWKCLRIMFHPILQNKPILSLSSVCLDL